jgi:hypothetical protein
MPGTWVLVVLAVILTAAGCSSDSEEFSHLQLYGRGEPLGRFHTAGGRLYDARGDEFVIRGVSNPHIWYDVYGRDSAYRALGAIAGYRANTVRIVWETKGRAEDLARTIERAVAYHMVPMPELHDATGKQSTSSLLALVDYWTRDDVKRVLLAHERHLLINIANEWSGGDYYNAYREAIVRMRAAGLRHTLVIDANGWGQNIKSIFDNADALLRADPERNLLFSVHMYESWTSATQVKQHLQEAVDAGIALIVGEFGFQHGNPIRTIPHTTIMAECERLGLGYIAWSWHGNAGYVSYLDLAYDWAGDSLSGWGHDLINGPHGLRATSRRADIFDPGMATNALPYCTANNGRGYGRLFDCGRRHGLACAKTDESLVHWCVAVADNGIVYCGSNGGRGVGDRFPCQAGQPTQCAKTDESYTDWCVPWAP